MKHESPELRNRSWPQRAALVVGAVVLAAAVPAGQYDFYGVDHPPAQHQLDPTPAPSLLPPAENH